MNAQNCSAAWPTAPKKVQLVQYTASDRLYTQAHRRGRGV